VLGFDPGGEARPDDLPGLEVLAIGDKYPTRTRELETSQENGKCWKIYFCIAKSRGDASYETIPDFGCCIAKFHPAVDWCAFLL